MKKLFAILLCTAALALAMLACGGSDSNATVIGTVEPVAPQAPVKAQTFKVGEVIELSGQTIVLNSVAYAGGELTANFTITNTSSEEMVVSTLLSFSARDSEGTKLEDTWMGNLGGTLVAGDKMKGDIAFKAGAAAPYKIYYQPDFGADSIVWEVTP